MKSFLLALALTTVSAIPAFADADLSATLTPTDMDRLAKFDTAREGAIKEARANGASSDVEVLDTILSGDAQTILGTDIRGDYSCRVAKLGGVVALVIYDWFRCSIGEDHIGYRLEKTTGSQRLSGHFIDESDTTLIFYGADHYNSEAPLKYNDDPERNTVGRMVKVDDDHYRVEFPLTFLESKFNILELERR